MWAKIIEVYEQILLDDQLRKELRNDIQKFGGIIAVAGAVGSMLLTDEITFGNGFVMVVAGSIMWITATILFRRKL